MKYLHTLSETLNFILNVVSWGMLSELVLDSNMTVLRLWGRMSCWLAVSAVQLASCSKAQGSRI